MGSLRTSNFDTSMDLPPGKKDLRMTEFIADPKFPMNQNKQTKDPNQSKQKTYNKTKQTKTPWIYD